MDNLRFGVTLEDGVSAVARRMASSIGLLDGELRTAKSDLAGYQAQLSRANAIGDIEGHRKYGALVEEATSRVSGLTQATEGAAVATEGLAMGAGLAAAAFVAVGAAAVAAGTAIVALGYEGVKEALDVVNANDRLRATFEALGAQGEGSGQGTLDFLDKLSSRLPQTREQLAQWTKQYEAMGVTDLGELQHQILATASAQAIMGDAGAAAYEKIEERVRLATEAHAGLKLAGRQLRSLFAAGVDEAGLADRLGLSVEQLGAGLKAGTIDAQKFGNALSATLVEKGRGPLQAMSDSMSVFADKFREEGRQLFDGIDTSPITDMLHELLDVGSQAEPSGRAIKGALTDALNGIIEKAGELGQDAQAEFLEIEADAVEMGVTVKGVGRVIGEAFDIGKAAASGLVTVIEAGLRPLILFGKAAEKIVEAGVGLGFDIAAHALADVDPKTGLPPGAPSFDGPAAAPAPSGGLAGTLGVHAPEPSGGLAGGDLYSLHAPANAEGGLVQPAKGEMFASVAPGEMIVPREITRRATGEDREPAPANDNGGRAGVHVDHLELHVHAKDGVTGAEELSVVGVMAALERLQLAAGR